VNANPSFPNASQGIETNAQESTAGADLNQRKAASALSPDTIARLACTVHENQGSQSGHDVKRWLEAEARVFGGVEREAQMHPGSSLFTNEH
jgi:hypothetical protein